MIKLNLPDYYANVNEATRKDLKIQAIVNALAEAVSTEELKKVKEDIVKEVNKVLDESFKKHKEEVKALLENKSEPKKSFLDWLLRR